MCSLVPRRPIALTSERGRSRLASGLLSSVARIAILFAALFVPISSLAQLFVGLESKTLAPVVQEPGDWGLKIVVFDVGQADVILLLAPNGDATLIDTGKTTKHGMLIADYLRDASLNGVGELTTVELLYSTHYDADHIGGLPMLVERNIRIKKAYDQGPSAMRSLHTDKENPTVYSKYLNAVGDPDGDNLPDPDESQFIRHKVAYGETETMGPLDKVKIRCVGVRGDTEGNSNDLDLDLSRVGRSLDKNAGSIALLVRLGEFELYTAGDQTSERWKGKPRAEEAVLDSGAIPGGNDIDVLKVSHHGSDTSTGDRLADEMLPEVAIISTKYTRGDKLPKRIVLKQLEENRSYVLITGKGRGPDDRFAESVKTNEDDTFTPSAAAVFDAQGDVTVLVSRDGSRYTVTGREFSLTFSARDVDNAR